jgi:hypothetical protein
MLVNGGRSGWARGVSLAAAVVVLGSFSALGFGCGSRTSMLDPDVYGVGTENVGSGGTNNNDPTPIGSAGKKPSGGGVIGNGGATSSTGNKGGASGVDPSLASTPCQQYCPGYSSQCPKLLKGQDCTYTCQAELNGYGPNCQALGIQAINCLAPFFSPKGGACDPAVNRALTLCSGIVTAFTSCKGGASPGTPTPTPTPAGTPARIDVTSCPTMGDVGGPSPECKMLFSCPNGSYETYCARNQQNPSLTDCTCWGPDGTQTMTQLMQSANVCFDAAHVCQ